MDQDEHFTVLWDVKQIWLAMAGCLIVAHASSTIGSVMRKEEEIFSAFVYYKKKDIDLDGWILKFKFSQAPLIQSLSSKPWFEIPALILKSDISSEI